MNSDGRTKANAAIVPAGAGGAVSVYVSDTTDVILDINGYFVTPQAGTYQFYPLPPCRLFDTRGNNGHLGGPFLAGAVERDFPLLEAPCIRTLPLQPQAYSLNLTPPAAVEHAFGLVALPRVLSQVGHHGDVGRILFAGEEVADDGLEVELPGVVPHGHEVGVVAEVEDLAAGPFGTSPWK